MNEEEIPIELSEFVHLLKKYSARGQDLRIYLAIMVTDYDFIQAMNPAQAEIFISDKKAALS